MTSKTALSTLTHLPGSLASEFFSTTCAFSDCAFVYNELKANDSVDFRSTGLMDKNCSTWNKMGQRKQL